MTTDSEEERDCEIFRRGFRSGQSQALYSEDEGAEPGERERGVSSEAFRWVPCSASPVEVSHPPSLVSQAGLKSGEYMIPTTGYIQREHYSQLLTLRLYLLFF